MLLLHKPYLYIRIILFQFKNNILLKNWNVSFRGHEVKEALRAQMEVQRRLHEQVEVSLFLLIVRIHTSAFTAGKITLAVEISYCDINLFQNSIMIVPYQAYQQNTDQAYQQNADLCLSNFYYSSVSMFLLSHCLPEMSNSS